MALKRAACVHALVCCALIPMCDDNPCMQLLHWFFTTIVIKSPCISNLNARNVLLILCLNLASLSLHSHPAVAMYLGSAERWRERWKRRETPLSPFHLEYEHHQHHGGSRHHKWDLHSSGRQQLQSPAARTLSASLCPRGQPHRQLRPMGDGGLQTSPALT